MVDLVELERIAAEDHDVRWLVSNVSGEKIVQGTTIRPHPWWVRAMQWEELCDRYGMQPDLPPPWELFPDPSIRELDETKRRLNELPKSWDAWLSIFTSKVRKRIERRPIFVTVHVEPKPAIEDLQRVRDIVADSLIPAGIEWRPQAELQVGSGDHVHVRGAFGTAGGFLEDAAAGKHYTVSCAHVLGAAGNIVRDRAGTIIGHCLDVTALAANSGNLPCDPVNPQLSLTLNKLDAGIVELNSAPAPTGLNPPSALRHGQKLDLVLNSGVATFQIRSLAMSMQLRQGATRYCYASLIELYSSSAATRRGDSGALGLAAGTTGGEWAVLAIGGDSISTFAVRASDVLSWCRVKVAGLQIY
jgi:hypothetical protein